MNSILGSSNPKVVHNLNFDFEIWSYGIFRLLFPRNDLGERWYIHRNLVLFCFVFYETGFFCSCLACPLTRSVDCLPLPVPPECWNVRSELPCLSGLFNVFKLGFLCLVKKHLLFVLASSPCTQPEYSICVFEQFL